MKIGAGLVGAAAGPRDTAVDARWVMAYAAALGETAPVYFDTTRADGLAVHPLFPVCYEWPLALELRAVTVPAEIARRAVHATHDLRIHRVPRVGDRLHTTATVRAVERRPPGAYVVTRFETVDARGAPVTTTDAGTLFLGADSEATPEATAAARPGRGSGPAAPTSGAEAPAASAGTGWSAPVVVSATLAHVYSECARIWNPIHTDRAAARAAGLPDVILHGTATLGLAVSTILHREAPDGPVPVARVGCRFAGMVGMPSTLLLRATGGREAGALHRIAFEVLAEDGRAAIRDGRIDLHPR